MNGLTARQQWTLDHIVRCSCGSWVVIEHWQLQQLRDDVRPTCNHVNPAAMGDVA